MKTSDGRHAGQVKGVAAGVEVAVQNCGIFAAERREVGVSWKPVGAGRGGWRFLGAGRGAG